MPGAGRVGDPIAHTQALGGFLAGAVIGVAAAMAAAAVIGAVATATAVEIASGGLATPLVAGALVTGGEFIANVAIGGALTSLGENLGEKLGNSMMGPPTGVILEGSPNVLINGRPAARVLDPVVCAAHGDPDAIAQGSTGVFINGLPAARIGDKIVCGGVIIGGSSNVIIGGGTVTKGTFRSEISPWARRAALLLSLAPGGFGLGRALMPALRGITEDGFLATAKAGAKSAVSSLEQRAGGKPLAAASEDEPPSTAKQESRDDSQGNKGESSSDGGSITPAGSPKSESFGQQPSPLVADGKSFAGHGDITPNADGSLPTVTVPPGTTVTIPIGIDHPLMDDAGQMIEAGNVHGGMVSQFADRPASAVGAVTYLPGAEMPNFELHPGPDLNLLPGSMIVGRSTSLSELLKPGMGHVNWAACTIILD